MKYIINQSLGCWSSAGNLRCDDMCYIPIKLEVAISINYQDSDWFFVHLNERWLEQLLKSSEISHKLSFLKESQLLIYKSYDELEVWWFTIEGLGWDSLLTMFHSPGGACWGGSSNIYFTNLTYLCGTRYPTFRRKSSMCKVGRDSARAESNLRAAASKMDHRHWLVCGWATHLGSLWNNPG